MANNRMYLVCRGCGKKFHIASTMMTGYYILNKKTFGDELQDFLKEHDYCSEKKEVNPENQFTLAYEFLEEKFEVEEEK